MIRSILLLVLTTVLFGCNPSTKPESNSTSMPLETLHPTTVWYNGSETVHFQVDDIVVRLPLPVGWEHYETDYGVVMAERIGSVASDGQLDGLLVHVFIPPLDDFSIVSADNQNLAWNILHEIIEDPMYIGSATPSDLVAFVWHNQPAAYYLMDNGEGNPTIVLGVIAPQTRKMVVCSISAPFKQVERIRHYLPVLLDGFSINEVSFSGTELNTLPNPFVFPAYETSADEEQDAP